MSPAGRRIATGLLMLGLSLGLPTSALSAHAASSAVVLEEPSARVDLSHVGPALVVPTSTLTVSGTITNTGAVPLDAVGARLRLVHTDLSRSQVGSWSDQTDQRTGTVVGPTLNVQPRSIPVAGHAMFTLAVDARQLGLAGRSFGPYGLAVEVRAQGELGRQQVGLARTTIQWQPSGGKEYAAQKIAWLMPITGLPGGGGDDPTPDQVAAAVGPGSRLRRLLDAASAPDVGWAVDPALLDALRRVATPADDAPTAPPATAPPSDVTARTTVAAFLAELRRAADGRVVIELPYADPDLAAVTAGGRPDLLRAAQAAGAGIVSEVLGVTPVTGVAWPAQGWADDTALAVAAAAGDHAMVLDADSRRLVDALPYTADARADLPHGVTGWLADPTLSALAAGSGATGGAAVRRLLAETAAFTSERPRLARRLLVVAPRDIDPDPRAFRSLVRATSSVPWLTVIGATDLRNPPPGSGGTADLPRLVVAAPPDVVQAGLGAAHVAAVRRLRASLAALGEVVDSPAQVTDALQRATLELVSCSWRGRPTDLRARRSQVADRVRALTDGVRVLPSSVNFLTNSARLQITVVNGLPETVTGLRLRVTSANPRLRVVGSDVATPSLAPATRAQVQVPVQALGSGKVQLTAQLVSPSGRPLGQSVAVTVRAQPTGAWALWVLGAVAAAVLGVGVVRALLRPRRTRVVTEGQQ